MSLQIELQFWEKAVRSVPKHVWKNSVQKEYFDNTLENHEIDLKEIFLSIWAFKAVVAFVCGLSIAASGYYLATEDKVYSATSTFTLTTNGGPAGLAASITAQLGGLASLAGLPSGTGSSNGALIERVTSREFILEVANELDLYSDKMFNGFDPNVTAPSWKIFIRSLLPKNDLNQDVAALIDWNVISSYRKFISIEESDTGSISVTVLHKTPRRASHIANFLVDKIIKMTRYENLDQVDGRLRYLSRTLADASEELSAAQDALKEFSLVNSAQAIESFAAGSVILDEMRAERERAEERLQAVLAVKTVLIKGAPSQQDYLRLREEYPPLDQSSFRRIMGISEVISAWRWPDLSTVSQVEESIRDRLASLDIDISKVEEEAVKYATSARELARLTRDLKIAEATYTVLIEQVKSQSLVAGFTPDNSKIIAVADVPIMPSSPKRMLVIAIGLVLGLFLGSVIALLLGMRKGVYYSTSTLLSAIGAPQRMRIKSLRRYRGKDLRSTQRLLVKAPLDWARQTVLQLDNTIRSEPVFVVDISTLKHGDIIGRIIAATAGNLDRNAALIDLSRYAKASDKQLEISLANKLAVVENADGCTEYAYTSGNRNIDMIFSRSLKHMLDALMKKHELVLFTLNEDTIETLLSSQVANKLICVAHVRKGRTRKSMVNEIISRAQIEGVYHA